MGPQNSSTPTRAERVAGLTLSLAAAGVSIGMAAWFRTRLAISFGIAVPSVFVISYLISRKMNDRQRKQLEDRLMGKPPEDPRSMANFVP